LEGAGQGWARLVAAQGLARSRSYGCEYGARVCGRCQSQLMGGVSMKGVSMSISMGGASMSTSVARARRRTGLAWLGAGQGLARMTITHASHFQSLARSRAYGCARVYGHGCEYIWRAYVWP
jgi:hypothetical protein